MVWSKTAMSLGLSASVQTARLIISSLYVMCLHRLWRRFVKVQRTYLLSIASLHVFFSFLECLPPLIVRLWVQMRQVVQETH